MLTKLFAFPIAVFLVLMVGVGANTLCNSGFGNFAFTGTTGQINQYTQNVYDTVGDSQPTGPVVNWNTSGVDVGTLTITSNATNLVTTNQTSWVSVGNASNVTFYVYVNLNYNNQSNQSVRLDVNLSSETVANCSIYMKVIPITPTFSITPPAFSTSQGANSIYQYVTSTQPLTVRNTPSMSAGAVPVTAQGVQVGVVIPTGDQITLTSSGTTLYPTSCNSGFATGTTCWSVGNLANGSSNSYSVTWQSKQIDTPTLNFQAGDSVAARLASSPQAYTVVPIKRRAAEEPAAAPGVQGGVSGLAAAITGATGLGTPMQNWTPTQWVILLVFLAIIIGIIYWVAKMK